jgi:energy-coupling factor transporter ATP-binding protein EcfA2/energy-coupling factor transporter transmembrane protein EcfT
MSNDLVISGLSVDTAAELPLLTSMNHCFKAGTVTLLLGRSGTGKTMLLELLSGLREPSSGQIRMGTEPLWTGSSSRRIPNRQLLLRLGTAFQHPEQQLFADTIKEEFLYTLRPYKLSRDKMDQRMRAALRLFPGEAKYWLERDPFTLSGGQQRRLSLALLQAAAPEWLLLDEPTAGIDAEGASLLCEQLQKRKTEGLGTLIVTHDPEALIALADSMLILCEGGFWEGTPAELAEQPYIWKKAGLALPARLETLRLLREAGFHVPTGWPDAAVAAAAIAAKLLAAKVITDKPITDQVITDQLIIGKRHAETAGLDIAAATSASQPAIPAATVSADSANKSNHSRLKNRDPRAVWLAYMLIVPGILIQSHGLGWAAALIVVLGVIRFARIPLRECLKPAAGLIVFTMLASLLSGLTMEIEPTDPMLGHTVSVGAVWQLPWGILFTTDPAVETFFRLSLLVMIMLIGFVLLTGINHLKLKRGLEQGLHRLQYLRIPVDQFALTASLIIRFLPMIIDEWHRFARIAAARGKYPFRPGQIPIFRLRMTMIPILVSLLRLGEALSLLLIVRGVGQKDRKPTIAFRLAFNRLDALLVAAAAVILLALILINYGLQSA